MSKPRAKAVKKKPARKKPAGAKPSSITKVVVVRRGPMAKYDAAQTTVENESHWLQSDGLSANAANSPQVRERLRNRARYETANNGYCYGLVAGRADDTIGTGPRLQLVLPETFTDPEFQTELTVPDGAAHRVEELFREWSDAIGLRDKLDVMDQSETRDGETFAAIADNPGLKDKDGEPYAGPTIDLVPIEADQICTPDLDFSDQNAVDGIRFDRFGNPIEYHVLERHPGDNNWWSRPGSYTRVPAANIIHWFTKQRAGQARGIPALTPALPIFPIMRRYTLAALVNAETAADITGVIEDPNGPADPTTGDPPPIVEMEHVPIPRGALLTLNGGKKATSFSGSQPAQGYKEFKHEVLTECGRSVKAARNVSTGSSAEYNYASGKLDHMPQLRGTKIRRDVIRRLILDRMFRRWSREALLMRDYLPEGLPPFELWKWKWRWDGFASIDPVKDATASQIELETGTTTLDDVCAEKGQDWEEVLEQQAREMRKRQELGLPMPAVTGAAALGRETAIKPEEEKANA